MIVSVLLLREAVFSHPQEARGGELSWVWHKQEAGLPEGTWGPLAHGSPGVLVGTAAGVGGTEVQKQ